MIHDLKCWPGDFAAIERGTKTHEARLDDRGFEIGHTLRLHEWIPDSPDRCDWQSAKVRTFGLSGKYTGRTIDRRVTHITRGEYGLSPDLAIMSIPPPIMRREMPARRRGPRDELRVGGCKIFVTINRYPDGQPCEVWLDMGKEGSALRHFMHGFAIAVSLLLQYGVPVDVIAHAFEGLSGGPSGDVAGHPTIKSAKSIIDMVAQLLRTEHGDKHG